MLEPMTTCSGCGGSLRQIWIVDKKLSIHEPLEYTGAASERSSWNGRYPIEGQIASMMCTSCGLVLLVALDYEALKQQEARRKEFEKSVRGLRRPQPGSERNGFTARTVP